MAIPSSFSELSTTAASNPPADSESVSQGDDHFRAAYAFIRALYEGSSNGQIVFPATQNASSNANTLDDYEENTFTPSDASGAGLTFSAVSGRYVKIGKVVFFTINVTYPSTADGSTAIIGSLPFTSNTTSFHAANVVSATTNFGQARVATNATTIALFAPNGTPTTNAQLSTTAVVITGHYEATA